MDRPVRLAVIGLACFAVAAQAGDRDRAPDPVAVSANHLVRLPSSLNCIAAGQVRVGLLPPSGSTFAALSLEVDGREILQMADLAGPGTVTIRVPRAGARVRVSATTSEGRPVNAARRYRGCSRRSPGARRPLAPDPGKPDRVDGID